MVASLGLLTESEASMAYTTTVMPLAAFDARVSRCTDAAALLLFLGVFVHGEAWLTLASIRDDAVHLF